MKRWSVCSAGGLGGLGLGRPGAALWRGWRVRGCSEGAVAELRRHAVMPPPRPHCHLFCSGAPNHDPNHGFTGAQGAARPMLVGQQGGTVSGMQGPAATDGSSEPASLSPRASIITVVLRGFAF